MRLLVFSSLFPNGPCPHHGVFVKTRLDQYHLRYQGAATVVAPVPRAPPLGPARWTRYRRIPARETVGSWPVLHPRFLSPPGFGDRWRATLMARGVRSCLREQVRATQPDLLDVHYAFPDAVAMASLRDELSAELGRRLPVVVTCRGTDLNLLPQIPAVRPQIADALASADHVVCVAEALRTVALELGVPAEKVTTLRNGVDLALFVPGPREAARRKLDLPVDARILLCVGHLIERKGQHHLVEAFARVYRGAPDPARLVLVGGGETRRPLARQVVELGIDHLVRFAGAVRPAELPDWYRAADGLVLASSREGWPNVLLEALACGTPVLATRVWGTPEVVEGCAAGRLAEPGVEGLATGLRELERLDASAARPWAERFGWDATVEGLQRIFEGLGEG